VARGAAGSVTILRACSQCGRPSTTSRCPDHAKRRPYRSAEYQTARAQTLAEERTCWLCGEAGTPDDPLTADHLVAVTDNGTSQRMNLRAAHRSCNGRRGAELGNKTGGRGRDGNISEGARYPRSFSRASGQRAS
jgi:5-methylcytosine-specific restriction endonuclease McrA